VATKLTKLVDEQHDPTYIRNIGSLDHQTTEKWWRFYHDNWHKILSEFGT
jgi:hypothetical protein